MELHSRSIPNQWPARRTPLILAMTTFALTFTTWGTLLYTPAAVLVTKEFDLEVFAIGYQVGLAYLSAMFCSLYAGTLIQFTGARRAIILAIILTGAGSLVTTMLDLSGIFLGTVMIGAGHSLVNPASAILLADSANTRHRSLVFSIKQTGTPLGGLATALITPVLAVNFGWRSAGYFLAATCFVSAATLWYLSKCWTAENVYRRKISFNPFSSILIVMKYSALRALTFMAMCYGCLQICISTFLSPFLVEEINISLVAAGGFLALAQASGGFGRPFWGWFSDSLKANVLILRILGLVTLTCFLGLLALTENSSYIIVMALCIALGSASIGWNGLFMAEIVNIVDQENISYATAGATAFTFTAATFGPFAFALVREHIGSFRLTIAVFAILALLGVIATFWIQSNSTNNK